jgi:hypothetical protein
MAAPFVSGTAALMRYQTPQMNSYQIKQLVNQSVDTTSTLRPYVATSGRVNVLNAVNLAMTTAVSSYQPSYSVTVSPHDREIASLMAKQGSGCGAISGLQDGTMSQSLLKRIIFTLCLVASPLVLVFVLKRKSQPQYKRRFDRFAMDSQLTFKVGDQNLVGAVKTISMGGSEINTEALLNNGSIITMTIASPDGKEKIEVQGHVVWSQDQKRYGVAFDNASDSIKAQIGQWQKALSKV